MAVAVGGTGVLVADEGTGVCVLGAAAVTGVLVLVGVQRRSRSGTGVVVLLTTRFTLLWPVGGVAVLGMSGGDTFGSVVLMPVMAGNTIGFAPIPATAGNMLRRARAVRRGRTLLNVLLPLVLGCARILSARCPDNAGCRRWPRASNLASRITHRRFQIDNPYRCLRS